MKLDRRSFFLLAGAAASTLVAACGAAPAPAAQPALGPAAPAAQGPRFSVDRTDIDYGNVKFQTWISAVFKVTNSGTAPLVLRMPQTVRAEAGC